MSYVHFVSIYDKYCPMLYGIALQIAIQKRKLENYYNHYFLKITSTKQSPGKIPCLLYNPYPAYYKNGKRVIPYKF